MWGNLDNSASNTSSRIFNDSHVEAGGYTGNTKRGENVVPVMIQQLINSDNDLKILGRSVHIITFVGILRHVENAVTKVVYEIEDETGRIAAFRWVGSEEQTGNLIFRLNTYVRVYGYLREQSGKKHVLIVKVWPLTDLNELTNHLLEVTYVTLKMEKMSDTTNGNVSAMETNSVFTSDNNLSGLTREQSFVFKIIQMENDTENGIEKSVLQTRVPKNIAPIVDDIIDFLTSEGHIYTTITDNHFKTT